MTNDKTKLRYIATLRVTGAELVQWALEDHSRLEQRVQNALQRAMPVALLGTVTVELQMFDTWKEDQ